MRIHSKNILFTQPIEKITFAQKNFSMKKYPVILVLTIFMQYAYSQKKNINAAWRALTDYQSTLNDQANLSYLQKAKENIDLAIQNPETKEDARTLLYHSQIYFELFKYYQSHPDTSINHYNYLYSSIESFQTLKDKHPKVATTPEIQNHGINVLNTCSQEAVKLFNDKKYAESTKFFEQQYHLKKKMFNTHDTASIFNALVSAYKANLPDKIETIRHIILSNKLENVKVYQLLYTYYQHKKDTSNALKILKQGRSRFSEDATLLNLETDYYISSKQYYKAIDNLEQMVQQDSTNALLSLTLGNLYDNIANQRMSYKNYSDSTEWFFQKAIENYMKSYRHKEKLDVDNTFTLHYNIGAFYTNFGLFYYQRKMKESRITDLSQKQKEIEDKRKEYTQMGLPYLKEAESIKPTDNGLITALYKVYALLGDTKNAELYKNKMLKK